MPELDAFERSLEAAFRAFGDRGVTPVDAIAFAERVVARPRRRTWLAWPQPPGRLATVSPMTWILALTGLLLALAIGGLAAGVRRDSDRPVVVAPSPRPLAACPPGSAPDEPGEIAQARPPLGGGLVATIDRDSARIVALADPPDGGGSPRGLREPETWIFDVCTNTWTRASPDREPRLPRVDMPVDAPGSDVTVVIGANGIPWVYDLGANTWTPKSSAPVPGPFRAVFDPGSGSLLAVDVGLDREGRNVWRFDVRRDEWATDGREVPGRGQPDHLLLAFDARVDRVVAFWADARAMWLLDPRSGVWTTSRADHPWLNTGLWASGGEIAFDEGTQRTVVFSDGLVDLYDAVADRWEVAFGLAVSPWAGVARPRGPQARIGHVMVYDPLNERLVVMGGQYRLAGGGWVRADDVWAFDSASREWIELLAPSRVEALDGAAWRPVEPAGKDQPREPAAAGPGA